MSIRTSTQAGNTGSSPYAFGSAVASGDQLVCAHAVTADASVLVGTGCPATPNGVATPNPAPVLAATGGGTLSSLPTGTYRIFYTNVDSGSLESSRSCETPAVTLTNGVSYGKVTLSALPSGVVSRNLYMTAAGGGALAETLYATGITGTSADIASATFVGGSYVSAAAIRVTLTGSLTVATGVTLTLAGDIELENAPLTLSAGSSLVRSGTLDRLIWRGVSGSQPNAKVVANGTSGSHVTISGIRIEAKSTPFPPSLYDGHGHDSISYSDFTSGTAGLEAWIHSSTLVSSLTIDHCTMAGGRWYFQALPPAASNVNVTNNTWAGTLAAESLRINATAPSTGARNCAGNIFDVSPNLCGKGMIYDDCYFDQGFISFGDLAPAASMARCFVRMPNTSTVTPPCPMTDSFFYSDSWIPGLGTDSSGTPIAVVTGALTGTPTTTVLPVSNTLVASTYINNASGTNYGLVMTSGAMKGQMRGTASNTTSSVTLLTPLPSAPASGDTYAIYKGVCNQHYLHAIAYGTGSTYSGNIFEANGTDNAGDTYYLSSNIPLTFTKSITLPNGAYDNSGTGFNASTLPYTIDTSANGGATRTSNVATIKTTAATTLQVGQAVFITGCSDTSFNGNFTVATIVDSTHFTFASTGSDVVSGSAGGGAVGSAIFTITHNTFWTCNQGPAIGDLTGCTGQIAKYMSNLLLTPNNGPTSGATDGSGPWKIQPMHGSAPTDACPPFVTGYNCSWNSGDSTIRPGAYQGNGYDAPMSAPGGFAGGGVYTDVDLLGGTGPGLVGYTGADQLYPYMVFGAWARSLGSTGTYQFDFIKDGLAKLRLANTSPVAGYTIPNLIAAIRAAYAPTNVALHNTAHDGTDIGAVSYVNAGLASAVPTIASAEQFGAMTAAVAIGSAVPAIPSAESWGSTTSTAAIVSAIPSITSAEFFGTMAAAGSIAASIPAILSAEAFGTATATASIGSLTSAIGSIGSAEFWGQIDTGTPPPNLVAAIVARAAADSTLAAIDRFYKDETPPAPPATYCVVSRAGSSLLWNTVGSVWSSERIRFRAYATDADVAEALGETLLTSIPEWGSLDYLTGFSIPMVEAGIMSSKVVRRRTGDKSAWSVDVTFTARCKRGRV